MTDLFSGSGRLEKIPVPNADVYFLSHLDMGAPDEEVLQYLIENVPWRQESVNLWGKRFEQPRLIAWFGDADKTYTYSGITLTPNAWTPYLLNLRHRVESIVDKEFNSVLLNYYRDNNDSMGFHSDDEPELGKQPVIASLSIGEERTFILKSKTEKSLKPIRLRLPSGSLLLMQGSTQENWLHGIRKESKPCGPRVNLTFRRICKF
ncbi:MAG: alpha-ketoglutarate-dependent dioxygenase AlkB [Pseudomonadota bacterium]